MYSISFTKGGSDSFEKLPRETQKRIQPYIEQLGINPRIGGTKKLKGADLYRLRVGSYRIIYSIDETKVLILIVKIAHRKDVYRSIP